MKIIQATSFYLPHVIGGIETYIRSLSKGLYSLGHEVCVALPRSTIEAEYEYEGQRVCSFPEGPGFSEWLAQQGADVFHQHSTVPPFGSHYLSIAQRLGLRTVITIQDPGNFCLRKTVMQNSIRECSGQMDADRCTKCYLSQSPVRALVAERMPMFFSELLARLPENSRGRSLSTKAVVEMKREKIRSLFEATDCVIAVSQWLRETFILNGCPESKIVYVPNAAPTTTGLSLPRKNPVEPLTIGFVGRALPQKGIELLIAAVASLPNDVRVKLIIHATADANNLHFLPYLRGLAAADRRILFEDELKPGEVPAFMSSVDIIAVPSTWKECAPLVVVEALGVGTPVVASKLGAMKEQVIDGVNGRLLPHDDVAAWTEEFRLLTLDPSKVERMRQSLRKPQRTMAHVVSEMATLYSAMSG